MARKALIAKEEKRRKLVEKYAAKRERLKEEARKLGAEGKHSEAQAKFEELQKLPRDASPVRQRNRCKLTGRPRGYLRKFGISRVAFRDLALEGKIPGIRKASW